MTQAEKALAGRLDALEEQAAHQARIVDELSEQIRAQWSEIDTLQVRQKRLIERVAELEEALHDAPPAAKPPHY